MIKGGVRFKSSRPDHICLKSLVFYLTFLNYTHFYPFWILFPLITELNFSTAYLA